MLLEPMKKLSSTIAVLVVLLITSCAPEAKVGKAYLSMEFTDTLPEFLSCWVYDHEGVVSHINPIDYVDDRTAILAVDSVVGFADVDVWTFFTHAGVRIVPDDTIHLKFTLSGRQVFDEEFREKYREGESEEYYDVECLNPVKDNDIVNALMTAFCTGHSLRYVILDDAGVDDSLYTHALPEMEQRFADFHAQYDRRLDKKLSLLADIRQAYMLSNMRSNVAREQGIKEDEVPGAEAYYRLIQPDNLAFAKMNLTNEWLEHEARKAVPDESQPQFAYAMLNLADSLLTNPAKAEWLDGWSKTKLFGLYPIPFNELPSLWERYCQVAADCPEVLAKWQKKYDQQMATAPGKPVNDITLQAPDGTEVQLSSLFGKLLYIDVWATWCVPCCSEIPYIEKLAEQFKGNEKVAFVSFSIDKTAEPWLQKLTADRPAWAQYRLTPEREEQFSADWDIQSIPRFLMIAPDGTICDAKAPRPSNPRIVAYIEECIQKYSE